MVAGKVEREASTRCQPVLLSLQSLVDTPTEAADEAYDSAEEAVEALLADVAASRVAAPRSDDAAKGLSMRSGYRHQPASMLLTPHSPPKPSKEAVGIARLQFQQHLVERYQQLCGTNPSASTAPQQEVAAPAAPPPPKEWSWNCNAVDFEYKGPSTSIGASVSNGDPALVRSQWWPLTLEESFKVDQARQKRVQEWSWNCNAADFEYKGPSKSIGASVFNGDPALVQSHWWPQPLEESFTVDQARQKRVQAARHRGKPNKLSENGIVTRQKTSTSGSVVEEAVGASAEAEAKEDEDLLLMLHMEGSPTAEGVLRTANQMLDQLSPEMTVEALHLAARHVPTSTATFGGTVSRNSRHQAEFAESAHFQAVLRHLRSMLPRVTLARALSRLTWSLGKFEVHSADTQAVVAHICATAPEHLTKSTPQDHANILWGMARLYPGMNSRARQIGSAMMELVAHVVESATARIELLSAQCLANALWSVARLRLKGPEADTFLREAFVELTQMRELCVFSPQGLANAMWAIAELRAGGVGVGQSGAASGLSQVEVIELCEAVAESARGRLVDFNSQELSMIVWAMAKLCGRLGGSETGRRGNGKARTRHESSRSAEVSSFAMALAAEAQNRLGDINGNNQFLSPQSVSNISWALATLDMLGPNSAADRIRCAAARSFLVLAMEHAARFLSEYSPQAVANLLWAAVRLESPARHAGSCYATIAAVEAFAVACAKETTLRMIEFSERDLAGVAAALAHCQLKRPEALNMMTLLVGHVVTRCHEMERQAMLNIAQSATRLCVPPQAMQPMVDAITRTIAQRRLQLNSVDTRQWDEVKTWCPPLVASEQQARSKQPRAASSAAAASQSPPVVDAATATTADAAAIADAAADAAAVALLEGLCG